MADMQIYYVAVTRDALTGRRVGNLTRQDSTWREVLVGQSLAIPSPAAYTSIIRDALVGHSTAGLIRYNSITKEALAGDSVGLSIKPQVVSVIREVLGRDASYKFQSTTREVLGARTDEWTSIAYEARSVIEQLARRVTKQTPIVVWSWNTVPQLVQQVGRQRTRYSPISMETVYTLRQQAGQRRLSTPPRDVLSLTSVRTTRMQLAMSRTIAYQPQSGVFDYTLRQQAAQRRAMPTIRSTTTVRTEVQQVALSRRRQEWRVAKMVQLVARARFVTFPPISVASEVQQVAQRREAGPQISPIYDRTLAQQVAALRTTGGIAWSELRALQLVQQLAAARTPTPPFSMTAALQVTQAVLVQRVPITYASRLYVGEVVEMVLLAGVPPAPYSGESLAGLQELVGLHRETAPPNAISSWDVLTQQQLVGQQRPGTSIWRSAIEVHTVNVQYGLAAVYPAPGDVIGPEVGAQVKLQYQQAAQLRVVEPPSTVVMKSRFVYQLAQQTTIVDAFPDKDTAYSDAMVLSVVSSVAVVDEPWSDPLLAYSDAMVLSVVSSVAVVDEPWPDPREPVSAVDVLRLHETIAVVDRPWDDPRVPRSDALALQVAMVPAVADVFADPAIPVSDVLALQVAMVPAVADVFADPHGPTSNVDLFLLQQMIVLRDKTLLSIPVRTDRRRAIVGIAIS